MSKYKNKFEKIEFYSIEYFELERIIAEYLSIEKKNIDLIIFEDWNNYSDYSYCISGNKFFFIEDDLVKIKKFKDNPRKENWPGLKRILCSMVLDKKLNYGNYLIRVFW